MNFLNLDRKGYGNARKPEGTRAREGPKKMEIAVHENVFELGKDLNYTSMRIGH